MSAVDVTDVRRAALAVVALALLAPGCATTPIAQVRIARPTERLDELVRFYRDGLGLPVIGGFEGHAGYDGVMIGMPDAERHLELTRSAAPVARAQPGPEDLLVLYYDDVELRDAAVARLAALGYSAVPPENPYWLGRAITIPDPDGWRVVLFAGRFAPGSIPERWRSPATGH